MPSRYHIVINSKFEYLRNEIEAIPSASLKKEGEVIYDERNLIVRIWLSGTDITVKSFHVPALLNRLVYSFFRKSKARRSYENALQLESLAIGTPEPIAYIEEYQSGLLRRSYYVCRMVEGCNIRNWETCIPDFKKMVKALAKFMFDMHQKGVLHKDFSPGNILFTTDEYGQYHFFLVDINRMTFGISSRKRLMRNFRCIYIESETETARLAREYAICAGLDVEKTVAEALGFLHKYYAEKARHRAFKRFLKRIQLKKQIY